MIVDDDPSFNEWLRSLLDESEDFEVVGQAYDGTEALDLITLTRPDVVIADVYMPGSDGLEVARYIHHHLPDVKIIVISAREEHIHRELAREEGALAFIPKTRLSLETLLEALQVEP